MLGLALVATAPEPDEQPGIEWLENPRSLESFRLESVVGEFSNQSLAGRWTIVLFGFLRCPDVCPTSLSELAGLAERLVEEPVGQDFAFVFVSVDPERDSVAELGQYVRHFNSAILGVTGKPGPLAQLADDLGIHFKVTTEDGDYSVAHSVTFSIIDPAGVFRGRFRPGFEVSKLIRNFVAELKEVSA